MSKKMNVGLLRQWLNEDRIDDPDKMVTNEMLEKWQADESECEHELCKTNRSVPCDMPKKIEKLEEYDLLNFENLGFKINEIIEKVNKE